jgi:uncharacterized OB-fold protein
LIAGIPFKTGGKTMETQELIKVPGEWHINYNYTAGETVSHFLTELRDNKILLGTKCGKCGKVFLPPKKYCEECLVPTNEWVKIGDEGVIEAFTFGPAKLSAGVKEPFVIAYVRLDGADTCIANYIKEIDTSDLDQLVNLLGIGKKVKVVYEADRKGAITDWYFKLK